MLSLGVLRLFSTKRETSSITLPTWWPNPSKTYLQGGGSPEQVPEPSLPRYFVPERRIRCAINTQVFIMPTIYKTPLGSRQNSLTWRLMINFTFDGQLTPCRSFSKGSSSAGISHLDVIHKATVTSPRTLSLNLTWMSSSRLDSSACRLVMRISTSELNRSSCSRLSPDPSAWRGVARHLFYGLAGSFHMLVKGNIPWKSKRSQNDKVHALTVFVDYLDDSNSMWYNIVLWVRILRADLFSTFVAASTSMREQLPVWDEDGCGRPVCPTMFVVFFIGDASTCRSRSSLWYSLVTWNENRVQLNRKFENQVRPTNAAVGSTRYRNTVKEGK